MCGPCDVEGMGVVPPYEPGSQGPESRSRVEASFSQCEIVTDRYGLPCDPVRGMPAMPPCAPREPVTAPGGLPAPVHLAGVGLSAVPGAPDYVVVLVEEPHDMEAYTRAATSGLLPPVRGSPAGLWGRCCRQRLRSLCTGFRHRARPPLQAA
jgi:hypothetical protein